MEKFKGKNFEQLQFLIPKECVEGFSMLRFKIKSMIEKGKENIPTSDVKSFFDLLESNSTNSHSNTLFSNREENIKKTISFFNYFKKGMNRSYNHFLKIIAFPDVIIPPEEKKAGTKRLSYSFKGLLRYIFTRMAYFEVVPSKPVKDINILKQEKIRAVKFIYDSILEYLPTETYYKSKTKKYIDFNKRKIQFLSAYITHNFFSPIKIRNVAISDRDDWFLNYELIVEWVKGIVKRTS